MRLLGPLVATLVTLGLTASAGAQESPPSRPCPSGVVARLGHTRLRHADRITGVAFAPDGKTVVTGGADGTVRAWSVETGEQVNLLQKSGQGITALKLTHGGKRVAVVFEGDAAIRLLDPATLKEVGSVPFANRQHFGFSADGSLVATTDYSRNLLVSEVDGDLPKLELADAYLFDLRPDGKAIAVANPNGTVTAYLTAGGKPVFTVKQEGVPVGVAYSPDGARLAVGTRTNDGTDILRIYEPGRHRKAVAEVPRASELGGWLDRDRLACGNDLEGGIYDLAKKKWVARVKGVRGEFAVSPDGTKLAATVRGLRLRLWDLSTGKPLHAGDDTFPEPALLAGSRDGRTLFILAGESAYSWKVGAAKAEPTGALPGRAVAAAVAGNALLVATPEAVLLYEDFDPAKPLPAKPSRALKDSAGVKAVAISATGSRVAWAIKGKVIVADATGKGPRHTLPVTTGTIFALAFNPAGDRLAVLGRDPFLRVWNVGGRRDEPKEMWKARVARGRNGVVAFSPDGKCLAVTSAAQVFVFEADNGKQDDEPRDRLSRSVEYGEVHHVAFAPDSRTLVIGTGGPSGRVELWDLQAGKLLRAFSTGFGGTSRLCVFGDGRRAASAGADESVTVWDLTARDAK
jgi:WD40 repeat protein